MDIEKIILLVISLTILLLEFTESVDALSCYKCSEKDNNSHCNEFYPSSKFAVSCGNKYNSCIQTYGSFNDFSVRGLGCGKGKSANSCSSMEIGRTKATICSCNGSLCNDKLLNSNECT